MASGLTGSGTPQAQAHKGPVKKTDADIQRIRKRLLDDLLVHDFSVPDVQQMLENVRSNRDSMKENGSWPDIDYRNKNAGKKWNAAHHTGRLYQLTLMYASPKSPLAGRPELLEKIHVGMTFWLAEEKRARGWYFQQLYVPQKLGQISLLLDDKIPLSQKNAAIDRLRKRSRMTGRPSIRQGANLLWFARNNVLLGCLTRDPGPIRNAIKHGSAEIKITRQEGIQPDRSFHQHGSCLHMSSYGAGYTLSAARLAWLLCDTSFSLSEDKLKLLCSFALDGQQWFVRGREFDYLAAGRTISRQHSIHTPVKKTPWRYLARLSGPRKQERKDFAARLRGASEPGKTGPAGNRSYWRSAMMVHRRRGYYASVRMLSKDIASTDACNQENIWGHHLSDGAMCLMRTGNEYRATYPLWNWRCVPGTTVQQGNPPFEWTLLRTQGCRSFVGGVSDSEYGAAAMDFARGPQTGEKFRWQNARRIHPKTVTLTAKKAWFFFDREIVCLGAGITGKTATPVFTTINQCRLKGDVSASANIKLSEDGGSFAESGWIHHDGFGYCFPEKSSLTLETGEKTGSWGDINKLLPGDTITDSMFLLRLEHGSKPENASYTYVILPDASVAHVNAYAEKPSVKILSNTPELQAVCHPDLKMTAAAFYKPGKLIIPDAQEIQVDRACILLVHELEDGSTGIALSKPDVSKKNPLPVTVTVGKHTTDLKPETAEFKGRSVVKILKD